MMLIYMSVYDSNTETYNHDISDDFEVFLNEKFFLLENSTYTKWKDNRTRRPTFEGPPEVIKQRSADEYTRVSNYLKR